MQCAHGSPEKDFPQHRVELRLLRGAMRLLHDVDTREIGALL
jgi:hypothetical protein